MNTLKLSESSVEIEWEPFNSRTLQGSRDSLGVPQEPDEEVIQYRVTGLIWMEEDFIHSFLATHASVYDSSEEMEETVALFFQHLAQWILE